MYIGEVYTFPQTPLLSLLHCLSSILFRDVKRLYNPKDFLDDTYLPTYLKVST